MNSELEFLRSRVEVTSLLRLSSLSFSINGPLIRGEDYVIEGIIFTNTRAALR